VPPSTVEVPPLTVENRGVVADCTGVIIDRQGAIAGRQGAVDLAALRLRRLSLQDVLIMEVIDLDKWIFTSTPRWVPTVMVYDQQ
jgi:hypothetical protein